MTPILLRLRDFKSFRGTHRFRFANGQPGLYFVTGENLLRPRLGANGVGKSSLFDAVIWALTGKTARGVGSTNVTNWDEGGGCEVRFKFSIGQRLFTLERGWKPNFLKLTEHGEAGDAPQSGTVTQDDLDRIIGIDGELLQYGLYVTQVAAQTFFDLSPADKQAVFTRLMRLGRWTDSAKRAAEDAASLAQQAEVLAGKIEIADKSAAAAHRSYREQRRAEKKFDQEQQARLQEIDVAIATAVAEQARLDKAIRNLTVRKKKVEDGHATLDTLYDEQRATVRRRERLLETAVGHAANLRAVRDQCKEQWHHMDKLGAFCTECQQKVDAAHRAKHIKTAKKNWKQANIDAAFADSAANKQRDAVNRAQVDVDATWARLEAAREELAGIEARGADMIYQVRSQIGFQDNMRAERKRVTSQENSHTSLAASAKSMRDGLIAETTSMKTELAEVTKKQKAVGYWVDGFKKIRLAQITAALDELTVETNDALGALGFPDAKVEYAVERETKSGSVSHGFQTMITPPGQASAVPWAVWSGGETQRLRLAGLTALMSLIHSRTTFTPGFEIWDEPTHMLSPAGVDDLLAFLAARASRLGRQIWLIDHRALPSGRFAATVRIEMTADGSRIAG